MGDSSDSTCHLSSAARVSLTHDPSAWPHPAVQCGRQLATALSISPSPRQSPATQVGKKGALVWVLSTAYPTLSPGPGCKLLSDTSAAALRLAAPGRTLNQASFPRLVLVICFQNGTF